MNTQRRASVPHSAAALLAGTVLLVSTALAAPAAAAETTVDTIGDLATSLADCATAPNTVTLSGDIDAPGTELTVPCDTTLELSTFDLAVRNIVIDPGVELEVTGPTDGTEGTLTVDAEGIGVIAAIQTTDATLRVTGGAVHATSGFNGSAIGGGFQEDAGTLIVEAGDVRALGTAAYAAAIGGGYNVGDGGVVMVTGGAVRAETASSYGVAVGGGDGGVSFDGGRGATITVDGGTLTAVATGVYSTAIGGGGGGLDAGRRGGAGGSLTIGAGGEVVASSPRTAFGGGYSSMSGAEGDFGSITVNGVLRLPSGHLIVSDDPAEGTEITVGATGQILGAAGSPTAGASITGDGIIDNAGVIALAPPAAMVTGNSREVTFDTADAPVRVFAPSMNAGFRALPEPPAGTLWNTASDGTGDWFTADSDTSGSGTTALFSLVPAALDVLDDPADLTATAGEPFDFPVTATDPAGVALDPQPAIDYASSDCSLSAGNVFEAPGECTVVASTTVQGVAVESEFTITVVAGDVADLTLTPSATEVDEGGSVTFSVTGEDALGNPVDTSGVTLTSSVATDVIDGLTVTFPTASPHTITASLGDVTSSVVIEVIPAPVTEAPSDETAQPESGAEADELAETGTDRSLLMGASAVAALLLLAGIALLTARRRA